MINYNPFHTFYPTTVANNSNTAEQIRKYSEAVAQREKRGLEGDGAGDVCFAAQLKQAAEQKASGESCGATDTVGVILEQMEEPTGSEPVTRSVIHNGVPVFVEKARYMGIRLPSAAVRSRSGSM